MTLVNPFKRAKGSRFLCHSAEVIRTSTQALLMFQESRSDLLRDRILDRIYCGSGEVVQVPTAREPVFVLAMFLVSMFLRQFGTQPQPHVNAASKSLAPRASIVRLKLINGQLPCSPSVCRGPCRIRRPICSAHCSKTIFIHLLMEDIKAFTCINLCIISFELEQTLLKLIYERGN